MSWHDALWYAWWSVALLQGIFWIGLGGRLLFVWRKPLPPPALPEEPLSIIICAKNEAKNLKEILPRILAQRYRCLEIVIVNDGSTDDTAAVVMAFQKKCPYLCLINVTDKPVGTIGKKWALTQGIAAAQYDWLLLTDADCYPASESWASQMMRARISPRTQIVLGVSPYLYREGVLNKWIRFEGIYTAIQYLSFATANLPYMGVGRNLLYHKSLFVQAGGFARHAHIASGDDDLFINAVATPINTAVSLSPAAYTYAVPKTTWHEYIQQKRRHFSTGAQYDAQTTWLLGCLSFSHIFYYLLSIMLIMTQFSTMFVVLLYGVRSVVMWLLYRQFLRPLRALSLLVWIPILDVVIVLYYLVFAPALIIKSNRW